MEPMKNMMAPESDDSEAVGSLVNLIRRKIAEDLMAAIEEKPETEDENSEIEE